MEILNKQINIKFGFQVTGMTPLMYAVKDNRTSLIERMIDLGSDVCARNNVSEKLVSFIVKQKLKLGIKIFVSNFN